MKQKITLLVVLFALTALGVSQCANANQNCTGAITAAASTCTAGVCVAVPLNPNIGSVGVTVSGTFVATLQFEGSMDFGTTWVSVSATPVPSSTAVTSSTGTGVWQVSAGGLTNVRVRGSAYTSGTATVVFSTSEAASAKNSGGGAPSGAAGGVLSGTYPNPGFAASPTFTGTVNLPSTTNFNSNALTTAATTAIGTSGATIPLLNGANTHSGVTTFSGAGALSTSGVRVSGTPFSGGDGTTTFPLVAIWASGATAPTSWQTTGTMLGINCTSGIGNAIDSHSNGGVSLFQVSCGAGNVTANGNITTAAGSISGKTVGSATNCTSSAAPAVCASAAAGSVVVAAAGTTVTVNTTAVTANSQIFVQEDSSLGTKLSVTCNVTPATAPPTISARTAATSFTITTTAPTTNPRCFSYFVVN